RWHFNVRDKPDFADQFLSAFDGPRFEGVRVAVLSGFDVRATAKGDARHIHFFGVENFADNACAGAFDLVAVDGYEFPADVCFERAISTRPGLPVVFTF